VDDINLAPNT